MLDSSPTASRMPEGRADILPRAPTVRSRMSNGSKLLAGVDGRSAEARRYRDLCMSYADDCGGASALTESQRALVRQAAALTVQSENLQAAMIRGEAIDDERMTVIANTLSRLVGRLERLGLQRRAKASVFSVADYLELKARRAADVDEAAE
jgi:hypothetical protein